ncbi:hypothetical protein JQ559_17865 [Bradyrhizobium viridifuturi]|mgnify:CR=1 FL=1|jgi:hypothetical protein|nr:MULTISPECIES: hypothetical protein [Bradyrhizobium]ERF80570.1 MAG: hypothetical protein C207_06225 [Bradyrhizobium sp. DFCI-1]QRI71797.1 hypothetical protein JQ507_10120 [Bradyrhizobium sp. PSBB068]MBR1024233.1 hypothetical protein [Bradyrhizobium viridifuturi]MBR1038634.1 hypothetical protein [Bradyrhizobium viridifuturi]MBR1045522.1 hypothetical protein [Bradyrhizobium viridifuturi]
MLQILLEFLLQIFGEALMHLLVGVCHRNAAEKNLQRLIERNRKLEEAKE